ncbi:MAG: NAD(+) diphosphatase [Sandaracinaceae bacterium]|nr:NAD(+) diphosphatase [Sandaracinaceae bacterium]
MRGDPIDRAAHLRRDASFLESARRDPATRLVPIWRGQCLVEGRPARARVPRVGETPELLELAREVVFLGLDGEIAVLMVDLPPADAPPAIEGATFLDLFAAGMQLPPDDLSLLAYARGMAHWHASHRFDPKTGAPTTAAEAGFARETPDGEKDFPRTDPAVMVLVVDGDRCLLARQPRFPPGMFSALAGFVEPGESLEECVARETLEEVGLAVRAPRYFASQPWPFPRSLMIGFVADAVTTEVKLDGEELEEARWVTRDEVLAPKGFFIPPPFSLAHFLILGWARG